MPGIRRFLSMLAVALTLGAGCERKSVRDDETEGARPFPPTESSASAGDDDASPALASGSIPDGPAERRLAIYSSHVDGSGPLRATVVTSAGDIECDLYPGRVPRVVAQFVGLATGLLAWRSPRPGATRKSTPLYEDLAFVRAIPDFLVQTGDPTNTGNGGPGFRVRAEFHPKLRHDREGTLAMVADPPGRIGSQFYVTLRATPHLDRRHPVFGHCDNPAVLRRIADTSSSRADTATESDGETPPRLIRVDVKGDWHPGERREQLPKPSSTGD